MRLQRVLLSIFLVSQTLVGVASEEIQPEGLCAPFRDSVVDPERVQAMISAAEHGHLYRIVPSTSRVGFCIDSEFSRVNAEFYNFQGGLSLWADPGDEEQIMVVIKVDSLNAVNAIVEGILLSEQFFDSDKYPEILFTSSGINWTSSTTAILKGDLTLHGVTRPVEFQVVLT